MSYTENKDHYFRIKDERKDYLGDRYFRMNLTSDTVTTIHMGGVDTKRGKSNNIGVYFISKMTFVSNYMAMNYIEPITKNEWNKHFEKIVKMLR